MSKANEKQVGGSHYVSTIQHWDYVAANDLDYFQAQITKYVARHKKKQGLEDLKKAQHFLQKYIEIQENKKLNKDQRTLNFTTDGTEEFGSEPQAHGYVDQD
tara:strand:- start:5546 stop:5851 length:306 start_codon:yes stop_codon:yes gene_type:complete